MIKILAFSPIKHDSTSFYRAYGVFPNLARQLGGNVQITDFTARGMTWADLAAFDIVFLQRPAHTTLYEMAIYARQLGVKVWVDFDDNLFALPIENRAFTTYTDDVKKVMLATLNIADVVTVSTEELRTSFTTMGVKPDIKVVPNALNDEFFAMADHGNFQSNAMAWRGSETHYVDVMEYSQHLADAMASNPGTTWHFMGMIPVVLARMVDPSRMVCTPPDDPIVYHYKLKKLAPRIMHVPLTDNHLNRSKSNIAWIEATFAGAVTLAPDWPEWRRPGVINYTDHADFGTKLCNLPDAAALRSMWQQSRDYIQQHLLLSHVNRQRAEIVNELSLAPRWQPGREPFKMRVERMKREDALDKLSKP